MQETDRGLPGVPEAISEAVLDPATPQLSGWFAPAGEEVADSPVSLPEDIRPRSRLFAAGAEALSPAEFLAVIFSAFPGIGDALALELSGRLLAERGRLYGLLRSSPCELIGFVGIGEARVASLLAAAELLKRGWSVQVATARLLALGAIPEPLATSTALAAAVVAAFDHPAGALLATSKKTNVLTLPTRQTARCPPLPAYPF
jgi:hypothetical protein